MTEFDHSLNPTFGRAQWTTPLVAAVLLLVAAAVRIPYLGAHGFILDELWSAEVATGRGSAHLQLPLNTVMPPPELQWLDGAPSWWHVWTRMENTHPPLYWLVLRAWMSVVGESDAAVRTLSVVASMVAVLLLYDSVRLMNGRAVAFWAALLMALAQPQVELGRQARGYALLEMAGLVAINALVRIECLGSTRRRSVALGAAILSMLLTHYFCIGAVAAIGTYALIRFRNQARRDTLAAIVIAGIVFAILWGPFMWQQRALFSTQDDQTQFLRNTVDHPALATFQNLMLVPSRLLAQPRSQMVGLATAMCVLFVLPFARLRGKPDLLLWGLWLIGTVLPLFALDLVRQTAHLWFIRYSILAGPAVYVLIPGVLANLRQAKWATHLISSAAVLYCALAVNDVYQPLETDPRLMASEMGSRIGPQDLVVFSGTGHGRWMAEAQYLMLNRYLRPIPCPIAIVNAPISGDVLARARASRYVFAFTVADEPGYILPGFEFVDARMYLKGGIIWQFQPR